MNLDPSIRDEPLDDGAEWTWRDEQIFQSLSEEDWEEICDECDTTPTWHVIL